MSEHTEERQGDLEDFMKRTGVVLGAALAVIALMTALWRWTPMSLRGDVDRLDGSVSRLARIVELGAVIQAEAPDSPEREEALLELRRLRRVSVLNETH